MYRLLIVYSLLLSSVSFAQVTDSLLMKGPQGTSYHFESSISENLDTLIPVDTNLHGIHRRYYNLSSDGLFRQDLNGKGSALNEIYFNTPDELGKELGYDVYNIYVPTKESVKYYDTKNYFTEAFFFQDFAGQQSAGVELGRSFNERNSFAVDFDKYATERLVGSNASNEIFVDNYTVTVNGKFISKDSSYKALAYYNHFSHTIFDNWGGDLSTSGDTVYYEYYDDLLAPKVESKSIQSEDRRNTWHLYHQFAPIKGSDLFQIYHTFDRVRRKNIYEDNSLSSHYDLYPNTIDSTGTRDSTAFTTITNVVGLKGGKRNFLYSVYAKDRRLSMYRGDSVNDNLQNEVYFGGVGQLRLKELQLKTRLEVGTNEQSLLQLEASIFGLKAKLNNVVKSSSVIANRLTGNHFNYQNNFQNEIFRSVELAFDRKIANWQFNPYYMLQTVNQKVYYDDQEFKQYNQEVVSNAFGLKIDGHWKGLYFKHHTRYQLIEDETWWRAPKLFTWTELYLQGYVKKYATVLQLGFDAWYRSSWNAYAYDPTVQQFQPQESFVTREYAVLDLFASAKVFHYKFYLKFNHVNQYLFRQGYFVTPYYGGQDRNIEVGLIWQFYD